MRNFGVSIKIEKINKMFMREAGGSKGKEGDIFKYKTMYLKKKKIYQKVLCNLQMSFGVCVLLHFYNFNMKYSQMKFSFFICCLVWKSNDKVNVWYRTAIIN